MTPEKRLEENLRPFLDENEEIDPVSRERSLEILLPKAEKFKAQYHDGVKELQETCDVELRRWFKNKLMAWKVLVIDIKAMLAKLKRERLASPAKTQTSKGN